MKKYLKYFLPNRDHLIGVAVIALVILIAFSFVSVNHNKYEGLTENLSDNLTENNYSNISENPYYYDKACWIEKRTDLSNNSYREKVKCNQSNSFNASR